MISWSSRVNVIKHLTHTRKQAASKGISATEIQEDSATKEYQQSVTMIYV